MLFLLSFSAIAQEKKMTKVVVRNYVCDENLTEDKTSFNELKTWTIEVFNSDSSRIIFKNNINGSRERLSAGLIMHGFEKENLYYNSSFIISKSSNAPYVQYTEISNLRTKPIETIARTFDLVKNDANGAEVKFSCKLKKVYDSSVE
jgi:hypothetical protein